MCPPTRSKKPRVKLTQEALESISSLQAGHGPESGSSYTIEWTQPFKAYTEKYCQKNLWRVSRTCNFDDAMQEARIVFLDCSRRYGHVDNAAWFMALYKRALSGRFADLSTADTRYRSSGQVMCEVHLDDDMPDIDPVGEVSNAGELLVALRQAPDEVRSVLSLLLNAPSEILELASEAWRAQGHNQSFGNVMLCRMIGAPERTDLLAQVRAHFE